MIYSPTSESITAAAAILRRGGLVAFPTETVYGLGGDARNKDAVEAIYKTKGRPSSNPLIVHIAELSAVTQLAQLNDPLVATRIKRLATLWPGPLSLVLPALPGIAAVEVSGLNTIAVRIPDHPVAQELIRTAKLAIAAPSANPTNFLSPTSAQHVAQFLGARVEMILDGGLCSIGLESTVVDISSRRVVVLRPGFILPQTIALLLEEEVELTRTASTLAPGQASNHYAPRTKLSFVAKAPAKISEMRFGYISFRQKSSLPAHLIATSEFKLSRSENLAEIASGLYCALHQLDQIGLDWILVDQCVNSGLGVAIMDRLSRAISKEN